MKNSKRYFPVFLLILMATVNIANAQTSVNVKAGLNFSNVVFENETGDHQSTQLKPGIHIGLSVDIPIANIFYIQPGLLYSRKGFKQENNWFAGSGNDFTVAVSYIELPVNFLVKPSLGKGKLLLGTGPYLGYGTGGKWESEEPVLIGDVIYDDHGDVIFKKDVTDGEYGSYMYGNPLDFGANFLVGYEFFNKISAQLNAQLGVANLQPEVDGTKREGTFKNIGFGISLGYKL